jgi:phosphoglycolate phosphatase
MNAALAAFGLPAQSMEASKRYVGEGADLLVRRAFRAALGLAPDGEGDASLPAPLSQLVERYRAEYQALEHRHSLPYPGVEAMLDGVVASGRRMAVLSNKRDDFTKHLVARAFSRWPFVDVRGEREGVPRKPDPTAAFELSLALDVVPARVGFVGDTAIDMGTARNAGMVPIGVLWGFRGAEELKAAGARYLLARPEELLGLLASA